MALENASYAALSSLKALRTRSEITANNVANMNTAGFKVERQIIHERELSSGKDKVSYALDIGSYTDMSAGAMRRTDDPFHVALDGDGFLVVQTPEGPRYTRDGRLQRAPDGTLTTVSGRPILNDNGGPIVIPQGVGRIQIAEDGTILAGGQPLDQLGVVRFPESRPMSRQAEGLFNTDEAPQIAQMTRVQQGMLENSNVQAISEMVNLMQLEQDYQAVTNLDKESEEVARKALNALFGAPV
ncbi:flagellar basal-body rod protein FlgF [Azospirillum sp. SYSU D00513]|uniref:flagellar basal-body rod protein FlgF n=1 Tax=Azospirillum sp. SYSU D00513 TaxID=2812561 RepID=UPI001A966225|nr:flagellar basal-body rod protein FlgF [Azospirillum sp. SYSU D00513]